MNQLEVLDKSIERWKQASKTQVLEGECPLCEFHRNELNSDIGPCIIEYITGEEQCYGTSYSEAKSAHLTARFQPLANKMLSELYEIRRRYIVEHHKGNCE